MAAATGVDGSCEQHLSFQSLAFGLPYGIFYDMGAKDICPTRRGMGISRYRQ